MDNTSRPSPTNNKITDAMSPVMLETMTSLNRLVNEMMTARKSLMEQVRDIDAEIEAVKQYLVALSEVCTI